MPTDLPSTLAQLREIESQLVTATAGNSDTYSKLSQQHKRLTELKELLEQLAKTKSDIAQAHELASDSTMEEIAHQELATLAPKLTELESRLTQLTSPKLEADESPCILEFRAGTGGAEASLFTSELKRAYLKHLDNTNVTYTIEQQSESDEGGLKESIISVQTVGTFGLLRFESGVHRVQRVPVTESAGRIHTSTVSLVVMPKPTATELVIRDEEIKMDVFRASGPGGQSVNTTDSAVRITHLPTNTVVTCQDSKSQHKNKERALEILRSKLYLAQLEANQAATNEIRSSAIRGGDRSAKIRTYNFPQGRITDHRIKKSWHSIHAAMEGDLEEIISTTNTMLRRGEVAGEEIED